MQLWYCEDNTNCHRWNPIFCAVKHSAACNCQYLLVNIGMVKCQVCRKVLGIGVARMIWQSRSENGKIKKLSLISHLAFVVLGRKSRSGKENTDISLVRLLEPNVNSHTVKHLFTPVYTDT